jgi:hypothetical protein
MPAVPGVRHRQPSPREERGAARVMPRCLRATGVACQSHGPSHSIALNLREIIMLHSRHRHGCIDEDDEVGIVPVVLQGHTIDDLLACSRLFEGMEKGRCFRGVELVCDAGRCLTGVDVLFSLSVSEAEPPNTIE